MKKSTTATYTIDHANKTITITKSYSKRANQIGTKEFRELASLHKSYPDYAIQNRTAVVSNTKNTHGGLNLALMKKYLEHCSNSEEALKEFETIKTYYAGAKGYYGKVKSWFLNKYPNYEEVDLAG